MSRQKNVAELFEGGWDEFLKESRSNVEGDGQ